MRKSQRRFGIEFEFYVPCKCRGCNLAPEPFARHMDQDEMQLALAGVLEPVIRNLGGSFISTGYDHSHGEVWHLKTDSSCGLELASPVLTWEDWTAVEEILGVLNHRGAEVNNACGMHVHHEVSDFTEVHLRRLLMLWAAYEKGLAGFVDPSRVNNRFCQSLSSQSTEFNRLVTQLIPLSRMRMFVQALGKYRTLNCMNWWRNGTVEVRLYQGTLDPKATGFWVALTQQFVELAKSERDFSEMENLFSDNQLGQIQRLIKKLTASGNTELVSEIRQAAKTAYPLLEV